MDRIKYDGVTWHKRPSGHYHNKRRGYLHRFIWEKANGPIPKGFVIHHRDHNVENNDLQNLEIMSASEHMVHHSSGRPTSDGQKAAASHSLRLYWNSQSYKLIECKLCGNPFQSRSPKPRPFCSDVCLEKWRSNAFIPEARKCEWCQSEYMAVKNVQRYCSKSCRCKAFGKIPPRIPDGGSHRRRKVSESKDLQPDS